MIGKKNLITDICHIGNNYLTRIGVVPRNVKPKVFLFHSTRGKKGKEQTILNNEIILQFKKFLTAFYGQPE